MRHLKLQSEMFSEPGTRIKTEKRTRGRILQIVRGLALWILVPRQPTKCFILSLPLVSSRFRVKNKFVLVPQFMLLHRNQANFSAVQRTRRVRATVALILLASCNRAAKTGTLDPVEAARPLAVFTTQRMIVTPTARVRAADSLGWVQQLGGVRVIALRLDTAIVAVLGARGLASRWILPADLLRSYERNRTYATDPYQLVVEQLRSPRFTAGQKYGEPLSSQLRTMIALHEDARLVLLPVELRFERDGSAGRAILRTVVLDPRYAEARFVADVKGDTSSVPARALATVALRLADLFVAP